MLVVLFGFLAVVLAVSILGSALYSLVAPLNRLVEASNAAAQDLTARSQELASRLKP